MVSAKTQPVALCDHCGKARHGIEPQCRACNYPAAQWAPNVQLAARPEEIAALEERYRNARDMAGEASAGLEALERIAERTGAVVNLPVGLAHSLFTGEAPLYSPYEQQLKGSLRTPAEPENDRHRRAVGGLLYGSYSEEMVYAALSADGRGLSSYGPVHLELEESCVAYRSTVLEENSYSFVRRHGVTPGRPLPHGYLARWQARGMLAVAKLAQDVKDDLDEEACCRLLLQSRGDRASDRFLEVHVYGTFNHQAVRSLALPGAGAAGLLDEVRQVQIKVLRERLERSGVPWKEA
jgi:hypothetical protein